MVNPDPEVRIGSAVAMVILVLLGRSETTRQTVRQLVLGALVGIIVPGFVITAHYALTRPGSHVPRLAPRSELSRMDVDGTFTARTFRVIIPIQADSRRPTAAYDTIIPGFSIIRSAVPESVLIGP